MKSVFIAILGSGVILTASSFQGEHGKKQIRNDHGKEFTSNSRNALQEYEPVLYWGANESGGRAYRTAIRIYAVYPPDVPISGNMKILSLHLSIKGIGKTYIISGDTLTEEFMDVIRQTPSGTTVYCSARIRDEKGVEKEINGHWELR